MAARSVLSSTQTALLMNVGRVDGVPVVAGVLPGRETEEWRGVQASFPPKLSMREKMTEICPVSTNPFPRIERCLSFICFPLLSLSGNSFTTTPLQHTDGKKPSMGESCVLIYLTICASGPNSRR